MEDGSQILKKGSSLGVSDFYAPASVDRKLSVMKKCGQKRPLILNISPQKSVFAKIYSTEGVGGRGEVYVCVCREIWGTRGWGNLEGRRQRQSEVYTLPSLLCCGNAKHLFSEPVNSGCSVLLQSGIKQSARTSEHDLKSCTIGK